MSFTFDVSQSFIKSTDSKEEQWLKIEPHSSTIQSEGIITVFKLLQFANIDPNLNLVTPFS